MPPGSFWEKHQQWKKSRDNTLGQAHSKVISVQEELTYLRHKVDRLSLASQAMWELLRDNTSLKEEHLIKKVEEIDLRDGVRDGRIGHKPVSCPECGRVANSSRIECIFCGAELNREHAFE